jgi:hypothetical protein
MGHQSNPEKGILERPTQITRSTGTVGLEVLVGHEIAFSGKAEDFSQWPLGFIRVGGDELFLCGVEGWPPGVVGKQLEVTGLLSRRKILADPTVDDWGEKNGAGVWGEQFVVDHARWRVVGDATGVGPKSFSLDAPPRIYQLEPLIGHQISVEGHPAVDATRSGLEVGLRFESYFLYVEGPDQWPKESDTQLMRVTGWVERKYDEPLPGLDSKGNVLIAARYRARYILTNARAVLLPQEK